jgi:hypothetical protein
MPLALQFDVLHGSDCFFSQFMTRLFCCFELQLYADSMKGNHRHAFDVQYVLRINKHEFHGYEDFFVVTKYSSEEHSVNAPR